MSAAIVLFVLILGAIKPSKRTVRQIPDEYIEIISRYANEYALEEAYIAAVIEAESSFRPSVVSYADARGLMQLLPDTAEWIARKLDEQFDEEALFEPDVNIRYGGWYLQFLMQRYNFDKRFASAAYHAGQGTVDRWIKNAEGGDPLDAMQGTATGTYVDRVLKYYEQYKTIFEPRAGDADSDIAVPW